MAYTETIRFCCDFVNVTPETNRHLALEISGPDIEQLLEDLSEEDFKEYASRKFEPEEIYPESTLEKWAEANGYVKGGDNG